jgi:uncharacterized protein YydD (DUF2326 family)
MKIISLFSKTRLIDEIIFKDGLNIILGKYSISGKDINGIGKTTIINFIDICLLADGPKHDYRTEKYSFLKDHSISLVIKIKNEQITLTKTFKDLNKVIVEKPGIAGIEYSDSEYRMVLGKYIIDELEYEGVAEPEWYRTIMSFFIQNDHNYIKRDARDVINFINVGLRKSELISFLFFLIGFNNKDIYKYDILQVEQKQIQADHVRVIKNIETTTGKFLDVFKSEIDEVESKLVSIEEEVGRYHFTEVNDELVKYIEKIQIRIYELQQRYFDIERKLSNVRQSMSLGVEIDINRIEQLYSELNKDFSKYLVHSIKEVQEFRLKIISNRRRFLVEREFEYSSEIETITKQLNDLEEQKAATYKKINQPKVLDDIKTAYSYLGDVKTRHEQNRLLLGELDSIDREIARNKKQISDSINEMVISKQSLDDALRNPKSIFMDLVRNSVESEESDLPTHLLIEPRSNAKSPVYIDIQVPRSGSLGKDRFKILAFDMTVFLSTINSGRSLPRFLIHDGVFHGIAHKTRIRYLNYVHSIFLSSRDAQYIITLNEDEISLPDDYEAALSHLDFDIKTCVIKTLEDKPSEMLLGIEF